jgi:hypothetical protein
MWSEFAAEEELPHQDPYKLSEEHQYRRSTNRAPGWAAIESSGGKFTWEGADGYTTRISISSATRAWQRSALLYIANGIYGRFHRSNSSAVCSIHTGSSHDLSNYMLLRTWLSFFRWILQYKGWCTLPMSQSLPRHRRRHCIHLQLTGHVRRLMDALACNWFWLEYFDLIIQLGQ